MVTEGEGLRVTLAENAPETARESGAQARAGAAPPPDARAGGAQGFDDTSGASAMPRVSVVIPCYNEERHIAQVLAGLARQWDAKAYEIVVVDGMSSDRTREEIARFRKERPEVEVRVVDNPARNIPAALNLGIGAARGEIVVRMDAHSVPSANYVRRCVEVLQSGAASIVGMPWRIRPGAKTVTARAIAVAVAHPFGIGDAKYRLMGEGSAEQHEVDTVPFGAFRKELWRELCGYNEALLANEDYDFNYRARLRGRRVVLDTAARSDYFARATLGALAAQYFRYGVWKARMVRLHPRSIRVRQLVAPVFLLALALSAAGGLFWNPARWLLAAVAGTYALVALVFAVRLARRERDVRLALLLPFLFLTIHATWGAGFLIGLARGPRAQS